MKTGSRRNQLGVETISGLATAAALDTGAFSQIAPEEVIPPGWEERAKKAWQYYLEEPIIKNAINTWRTFAVGEEVKITSEDPGLSAAAKEMAEKSDLSRFVKDMILQLLVKGDAVGFRQTGANNRDLEALVSVNPVSVKVIYSKGEMVQVVQKEGSSELDLPVEKVIHLKWDAPSFSPRGNSMILPAFRSLELLRDYRRAEAAIAKRWATPLRLVKVGGSFGPKVIMPDQKMLTSIRDMINKMDMKSGLVVPFYVDVETYGADGAVLDVEQKVKEVKEDIIVAMGLSKSLVTGDGPTFATASVSMQKLMVMIREIKQAARRILNWVFKDFLDDEKKTLQFHFNDLDPTDAIDFKRLLLDLYDRGLISKVTLQTIMDLDPAQEKAKIEKEASRVPLQDQKMVQTLIQLVSTEMLSPEAAAKILGVEKPEPRTPESSSSWGFLRPGQDLSGEVCDGCAHFNGEANQCLILSSERTFDDPACRFFDRKISSGEMTF